MQRSTSLQPLLRSLPPCHADKFLSNFISQSKSSARGIQYRHRNDTLRLPFTTTAACSTGCAFPYRAQITDVHPFSYPVHAPPHLYGLATLPPGGRASKECRQRASRRGPCMGLFNQPKFPPLRLNCTRAGSMLGRARRVPRRLRLRGVLDRKRQLLRR